MIPNKIDAIYALVGGVVTQKVDGEIVFHDGQTPPTEEQIQAKLAELKADEEATQYQRDRAPLYPDIGDQLDQLYHDMADGKLGAAATTGSWFVGITSVKTSKPKPS